MSSSYKLFDFANRDRAEVMRFVFSLADVEFEEIKFELPSAEWDEYKKCEYSTAENRHKQMHNVMKQ